MPAPNIPRRLPNGSLVVPKRAESNGIIGDGAVILKPGDPEYDEWDRFMASQAPPAV